MSNTELITCDYLDCKEPFAYRINGFNLCAEHCGFDWGDILRSAAKKAQQKEMPPERSQS